MICLDLALDVTFDIITSVNDTLHFVDCIFCPGAHPRSVAFEKITSFLLKRFYNL